MTTTIFTGPTAAARAEFIDWLRGVLAAPEHARRHADAAIAEHDWEHSLSLEIRGIIYLTPRDIRGGYLLMERIRRTLTRR